MFTNVCALIFFQWRLPTLRPFNKTMVALAICLDEPHSLDTILYPIWEQGVREWKGSPPFYGSTIKKQLEKSQSMNSSYNAVSLTGYYLKVTIIRSDSTETMVAKLWGSNWPGKAPQMTHTQSQTVSGGLANSGAGLFSYGSECSIHIESSAGGGGKPEIFNLDLYRKHFCQPPALNS